ncbi:MAG: DUF192 domain-containing protein [Candidatus Woesearchaeota archaeon]
MLITLIFTACNTTQKLNCENKIHINTDSWKIDLAQTEQEQRQGLMNIESMPENKGMLFIFEDEKKQAFWMKNTLIPLDIIWINSNYEIIHIETAEPCTSEPCKIYTPTENAKYVLEINAGLTEQKNIELGMKTKLELCN